MSTEESDCGCGSTPGQLADKLCLKIEEVAGSGSRDVCVTLSEDYKTGKISTQDFVKKLSTDLNIGPDKLDVAFSKAISELKRPEPVPSV